MGNDSGMTPVIGAVLIFAFTMAGIATALVWGGPLVNELESRVSFDRATQSFLELKSGLDALALSPSSSSFPWVPEVDGAQLLFDPTGDRFVVQIDHVAGYNFSLSGWADRDQSFSVNVSGSAGFSIASPSIKGWVYSGVTETELFVNESTVPIQQSTSYYYGYGYEQCLGAKQNLCFESPMQPIMMSTSAACASTAPITSIAGDGGGNTWVNKTYCVWTDAAPRTEQNLANGTFHFAFYSGSTVVSEFWLLDVGALRYVLPGQGADKALYLESGSVFRSEKSSYRTSDLGIRPPTVMPDGEATQAIRFVQLQRLGSTAGSGYGAVEGSHGVVFTAVSSLRLSTATDVARIRIYAQGPAWPLWLSALTDSNSAYGYTYNAESSLAGGPSFYAEREAGGSALNLDLRLVRIGVGN